MARAIAEEWRGIIRKGGDPKAKAKPEPEPEPATEQDNAPSKSMREVFEDFMVLHHQAKRNRNAGEVRRVFEREVLPLWGKRPVTSITRADVVDLINGIVKRGSPGSANNVLSYLRTMFNWAECQAYGIELAPTYKVKAPVPRGQRERVLTDAELRAFWAACDRIGKPMGRLFQFMLVTMQREDECAGIRRDDLFLNERGQGLCWKIPKEVAKNKIESHVPLSWLALRLLEDMSDTEGFPYFFTTLGTKPVSGFSNAKETVDNLMCGALGIPLPPNLRARKLAGEIKAAEYHRRRATDKAKVEKWERELASLAVALREAELERDAGLGDWWVLHDLRRTGNTRLCDDLTSLTMWPMPSSTTKSEECAPSITGRHMCSGSAKLWTSGRITWPICLAWKSRPLPNGSGRISSRQGALRLMRCRCVSRFCRRQRRGHVGRTGADGVAGRGAKAQSE